MFNRPPTHGNPDSPPSAYNLPYLNSSTSALQDAYGQASPIASGVSTSLAAGLTGLGANVAGGANALGAANSYVSDVLGGKYLGAGNPLLAAQIAATNQDVGNDVNSAFSAAGRTGSGANQYALGRALANNETNARYTDYTNERQAQANAASLAPNLSAQGLGAYLTAANSAVTLPQQAASTYAGGLGSLIGSYNTSNNSGTSSSDGTSSSSGTSTTNDTTVTKSNPGLLTSLGQLAQIGSLVTSGGLGSALGIGPDSGLLSAGTTSLTNYANNVAGGAPNWVLPNLNWKS